MNKPMILAALIASVPMLLAQAANATMPQSHANANAVPPVILTAGKVVIEAPETVDPGASIAVAITGGTGGHIELWGPITQSAKGGRIDSVGDTGGSAVLTAPTTPGSYELRYVNAAGAMLARLSLDVAAIPITLSAPHGLGAGIDTRVEWRGPASPGDTIQVYDPVSGAVVSEAPAEGQPGAVNVAVLRGPETLGDFQIRYWSGTRQVPLRSLPVAVQPGDAWLRTPIEVFVGEIFLAEWQGPSDSDHIYQIVDPATSNVVTSLTGSGAGMAKLKAPSAPGAFRVQLINAQTGFVLADLPLDVDAK
jgi:Ca-activated chloride channel family protein